MKSWFDVPTTQMPIFLLSVSARVLFDGAFSLWVSLKGDLFHLGMKYLYEKYHLSYAGIQPSREGMKNVPASYNLNS